MYTPKILSFSKRTALICGDFFVLLGSLYVTLALRYQDTPSADLYSQHLAAFLPVFIVSLIAFFIAGLHDKDAFIYQGKIFSRLSSSYVAIIIASLSIFYIFPYAGLTPKITLLWYIVVSYLVMFVWRLLAKRLFSSHTKYKTLVIGEGEWFAELVRYMKVAYGHPFSLDTYLTLDQAEKAFKEKSLASDITAIVFDFKLASQEHLQEYLYEQSLRGVFLIDAVRLYEDVFEKLALPSVNYGWFFEHSLAHRLYEVCKRLLDIIISIPLIIITLILSPFVALSIWLEDRGPILIAQKRMGRFGKILTMYKFRTMRESDHGVWLSEKGNTNKVTKVGYFLRASRIDELPQLWNILKGELSLIGPRPDILSLGQKLQGEIPYYQLRYIVTPGLSGWAQIMQEKPPQSVEETKLRLQYDLYYIKHRSITLEFAIALKTIKTLLMRTGM